MTREELRDYVEEQRSLNNIPYHVYSALIDGIDTPEQESKTGHWIDSSNGWMCSECNKDNTFDTNYCPNCGARMVDPQESEE